MRPSTAIIFCPILHPGQGWQLLLGLDMRVSAIPENSRKSMIRSFFRTWPESMKAQLALPNPNPVGDEPRSDRERGLFERGVSQGLALPVNISYADLPMKNADTGELELVQWPFLAPHDFASWL